MFYAFVCNNSKLVSLSDDGHKILIFPNISKVKIWPEYGMWKFFMSASGGSRYFDNRWIKGNKMIVTQKNYMKLVNYFWQIYE